MGKPLVIVESPAKARTIAGFLGSDYVVESSVGHIRDLPQGAAEVPAAYKGEPWARLGVDTDNGFKPLYVVTGRAKDQVRRLKTLLKDADELLLATDEDREGEAIAWHLLEVLSPRVPVKRMVFHEITKKAIDEAIAAPRDLDRRLVDAQEARRILDRLYGYEVSPVLWRKVMSGLSAGRVQSVAVRIIVERERERIAFVSASYWSIAASVVARRDQAESGEPEPFGVDLARLDDVRIATGRDFDEQGRADRAVVVLDASRAGALAGELDGEPLTVAAVDSRPYRRRPAAPFMTSTLQQEAGRKLGFGSARTMRAAQRLYENGYITYMRTDSTTLSAEAVATARRIAADRFGAGTVPPQARSYANKVKNAQEAHEAIRPAGEQWRHPDAMAGVLSGDEARVYDLVWRRTVASQMIDATGETVSIRLTGRARSGEAVEFSTSGTVITSPGFRLAYVEATDDDAEGQRRLPQLTEGDVVDIRSATASGHETSPPARYTEASLVRRLEELGVGRPSTYASIMETIQDRGYVWKRGTALVPAFIAMATVALLEGHFPELVDYAFTARMEDDLDAIAAGEQEPVPWLSQFYFGSGDESGDEPGLKTMVSEHLDAIDAKEINSFPLGMGDDGVPIVARPGRYGPYLQHGERMAPIPEGTAPDELTLERAVELLDAPSEERVLGTDPDTGLEVIARPGRFGPYVSLGRPDDGGAKPRTASLLSSMDLTSIDLDAALRLLTLPRVVGSHPDDGVEISALNGRYGPYLKKGDDSRSLESENQLFTVTLAEAVELFAQPKRRWGQTAPVSLRELGPDPDTGRPMVLRDGRFGPYVTDGETNASLRKGDTVDALTVERASELLAERRAKGPASGRRGGAKKATAKKAAKKRATPKKAAARKKAPAKRKAAAKKAAPRSASAGPAAGGPEAERTEG